MTGGRWTCYMCAGAFEQAEENPEEYSIVSKFGWDRNVFYGDNCSETESVLSEDWRLSHSLSDCECERAKSEKQSHFKVDSAVRGQQCDQTCSPPLRICGRLPTTGEDSEGDVSV